MDDDEVEWVEGPPKRWGPRTKPALSAAQEERLRANPGRWAKVREFPGSSSAHQARKRWRDNPQHLVREEWEAEARKFADGSSALFMRYVGGAQLGERVPDQGPDGDDADGAGPGGSSFFSPQEPAPATVAADRESDPEPAPPPAGGAEGPVAGAADASPSRPPSNFETFTEVEPVEVRTCPVCGDILPTRAGMLTHKGRKHKAEIAGLRDASGAVLAVPAVAAALEGSDADEAEADDDGPCGPCLRNRCQFCHGGGCECDRSEHFSRAPRARLA